MDIYDEAVNNYFEYAKSSILQINQVMGRENDGLVDAKSIVFSAMLAYYGLDCLDDIYLAFLKTDFVSCGEKVETVIGRKYNLSSKQIDFIRSHCPGTFYEVVASKDLTTNKCKFKRTIYVDEKADSDVLLRGMIHQMNHVINSIHHPVLKKQGNLGSRMGLAFEQFESRKSNEFQLEEAINELQTSDIMSEAMGFRFYKIDDSGIKELLDSAYALDLERKQASDGGFENVIVQIVKPLYDHELFGAVLIDDRLTGKLNEIKRNFDENTEPGSFGLLLRECGLIESDNDDVKTEEHVETAKTLVKRYIDNCNL